MSPPTDPTASSARNRSTSWWPPWMPSEQRPAAADLGNSTQLPQRLGDKRTPSTANRDKHEQPAPVLRSDGELPRQNPKPNQTTTQNQQQNKTKTTKK